MKNQSRYLSFRWKIIFLAAIVLGLTSFMFIWQQHELQLHELEIRRTEFREHSHNILEHLLMSQANRITTTGNLLIKQPEIAEDLLHNRVDALIRAVQSISLGLASPQDILSVTFFDEHQKMVAAWGESLYADIQLPHENHSSSFATPQQELFCRQICVQQITLPISLHGRRIGSVALVSDLGQFLNDLHRLTQADIVMLQGRGQNGHIPLASTSIASDTSLLSREWVSTALNSRKWQNGFLQINQDGQVYQLLMLDSQRLNAGGLHPLLIKNITNRVQLIENQSIKSIISGLSVFLLALCLLYFSLRPTMKRFSHLNRMLPMLGNGQKDFNQIRAAYSSR